jgi:4'-phosphopantetheinyl transferase
MRDAEKDPENCTWLNQAVHVWRVPLSQPSNVAARLEALLSPEEARRASRFHFAKDRRRYAVARGALRTILSDYLEASPQELRFANGRFGKPYLLSPNALNGLSRASRGETAARSRDVESARGEPAAPQLHFNLSHCEDLALIAVSAEHLVGVDVEKVRGISELSHIVERYFSGEEKRFLDSVPKEERPRAFLALWSRREATAKALGLDLSAALGAVKVPVYRMGESILLRHLGDLETDAGEKRPTWLVRDLDLDGAHVGALCSEGPKRLVQYADFRAYR